MRLRPLSARALVCWSVALGAGAALVTRGTSANESPAQQHSTAKAFHRPAGTGRAYWGPGDMYTFLATSDETNGAYFQFEAMVPAGGGPPPHIHDNADESFYLVEGKLEMRLGNEVITANGGDFVNVPKGTVHGFKNVGTQPAKMVVSFIPGGFEKYFEEVFTPATDRNAAPPPVTEALIQKMIAAGPKHHCQILPPPSK